MKSLKNKIILCVLIFSSFNSFAATAEKNLLIIGDSLGDGFWLGINNDRDRLKNEQLKTIKGSVQGQSITGKGFLSYLDKVKEIRTSVNPDYVVIWIGANDQAPEAKVKGKDNPSYLAWQEIYKKNALKLLDVLKVAPDKVYWVSLPIMRGEKNNNNAHLINSILKQISLERKVRYVDIEKYLTDESGNFSRTTNYNGKFIQIRADDGVHFTTIGYKLVTKQVPFN